MLGRSLLLAGVVGLAAAMPIAASETPSLDHFLFDRLVLPTAAYKPDMGALTQGTEDFAAMAAFLTEAQIPHAIDALCVALGDFPADAQPQIAGYVARDTIVIGGAENTAILKVRSRHATRASCDETLKTPPTPLPAL